MNKVSLYRLIILFISLGNQILIATQPIETLLFSLSSKIDLARVAPKEKRAVTKAIESVSTFERILTDYQKGAFAQFPLISKSLGEFINFGNEVAKRADTIDKVKPWDIRKLHMMGGVVLEKTAYYLRTLLFTLTPQDRDRVLTTQEIFSAFTRFILNSQFIPVGSRFDYIVDLLYYRPKEWVSKQKNTNAHGVVSPVVSQAKKEEASGEWQVLREDNLVQYRAYNQFGEVTKYCRSSGVFCGGHSVVLVSRILDEQSNEKISFIARDYKALTGDLISVDSKTAALRVANLLGESHYAQLDPLTNETLARWLIDREKKSDHTAKSLGDNVVNYIKVHKSEVIKEGVVKWAHTKVGTVTNRQKLDALTNTDWHVESELEQLVNPERITVITDAGLYDPQRDFLGYLSRYSNELLRAWLDRIEQSSHATFEAVKANVLEQSKLLWKKIKDLRENRISQGIIIRDGAHWFCAKLYSPMSGTYEMVVLDTMNIKRLDNSTVRTIYNVFTSSFMPSEVLLNEYILVGIYAAKESSLFDQKQKREILPEVKQQLEQEYKKIFSLLMYHMALLAKLGGMDALNKTWFLYGIQAKLADIFKDRLLYLLKQKHIVSPLPILATDNQKIGEIELTTQSTFEQFFKQLEEMGKPGA